MQSRAKTVREYLDSLPEDRRRAVQAVCEVVRANLDPAYAEGIGYGMIGWSVPHSVYPAGYHCNPEMPLPFASVASQKHHVSVYLMCVYMDPAHEAWFREAWARTGKKLDMGKGCVRFRRLEDAALDVIGEAVRRVPAKKFIEHYERTGVAARKPRTAQPAARARPKGRAAAGRQVPPAKKARAGGKRRP